MESSHQASSAPSGPVTPPSTTQQSWVSSPDEERTLSPLLRATIWVAIGALIAAALVCVVWVLVGNQSGIIGRAFMTVFLLTAFAGVTILDAHLAPRRPSWFALSSMVVWVVLLLIGAFMIWMPERGWWGASSRLISFLLIVLIFQLALLHVRLYAKAWQRHVTTFTTVVAIITVVLVGALAVLLTLPLMLSEYIRFHDIYGRIVVATAILAAVGTVLLPLVNVLLAPRPARPATIAGVAPLPVQGGEPAPAYGALAYGGSVSGAQPDSAAPAEDASAEPELLPWPTYVDGVTPLPMLPDGTPDWNAYYTGQPTPGAHIFAPPPPAPPALSPEHAPARHSEPGLSNSPVDYRDFPPPPPLPPRP
ncbi:hypothetical protein [Microbacterium sp. C7(2022)]|uniref:hypothetical protein n=1 Tax=Microbacterium sp. C7(2022) TaxID=2992759 RepID=UPI00237B9A1D|nr:hypothetical protein [Microbacterium sp. C7(2022)]